MNLAEISIKRPIFITCTVLLMLAVGYLSMSKLPIDLFPNVTFPVVTVNTVYPGAGPREIETLVSKPIEEELSTLPGIKTLRSINKEGLSTVVAQFTLETDIKYAEQQVRDRVGSVKRKLPTDINEPVIRRVDPSDQPILILAITADLPEGKLFDLADEFIRPKIEQIDQVGLVEILGGRKREVHVELDRQKLKSHEISASQVSARIEAAGKDIPVGKYDRTKSETVFRALGEFKSLKDIESTIVSFYGNDVPVSVGDVGKVVDTLEDEKSRTMFNGTPSVFLMVFRQSGSNTVKVADNIQKRIGQLNEEFKSVPGKPTLTKLHDSSRMIRANVEDVKESIFFGIFLTIVVVFFFLGNGRSTLITGLALPNSLLGAFILMAVAGFTINMMTLLALSLTVGLLVDDAIVVRENIFRHMEMGKPPKEAALIGTKEVSLAVIATTLTILAVFGPIAFLKGVVGQFFKEFGMTICFAMLVSLYDAFSMAPMLSAYFAGNMQSHNTEKKGFLGGLVNRFNRFQDKLEDLYEKVLHFTLRKPKTILFGSLVIFVLSLFSTAYVPKTFLSAQDYGEFMVSLDMPPGTSLNGMSEVAKQVDEVIRKNPEVYSSLAITGNRDGEANVATFYVELVPSKQRKINTSQAKDIIRQQLKPFAYANPVVKDVDAIGAGLRPFNVNIVGSDLKETEEIARELYEKLKNHPALKDVEISSKPGKPELQVSLEKSRAESLGISSILLGQELRTQIQGSTPAVFRENGLEYDIRVRLQEDQRNLKEGFNSTYIPNINGSLVKLTSVANPVETSGPANINRQDRGRYVQVSADIAPGGPGMGGAMSDITKMFSSGAIKLKPGMRYMFVGQAEDFAEMMVSMLTAMGLGILFIYLVLASLYESFVIPFTIMLVLPLAAIGAFLALLITQHSLDIFSMIGCIMLLGIATKNSILLVDYANQQIKKGVDRNTALLQAGRNRLRPILMTTVALIAGMLPVAIGLNEASKQRTSMGISIIGGLISSTLLTLVVVPAAFSFIDRFRIWSGMKIKKWVGSNAGQSNGADSRHELSQ